MNKAIKIAALSAAVVAAGVATSTAVSAWGDNTNGRKTYTVEQIKNNALGDKIVFNSMVISMQITQLHQSIGTMLSSNQLMVVNSTSTMLKVQHLSRITVSQKVVKPFLMQSLLTVH